jgi:hypothetical protein
MSNTQTLLAFVELVSDHLLGDTIALPVNITTGPARSRRRTGSRSCRRNCRHRR